MGSALPSIRSGTIEVARDFRLEAQAIGEDNLVDVSTHSPLLYKKCSEFYSRYALLTSTSKRCSAESSRSRRSSTSSASKRCSAESSRSRRSSTSSTSKRCSAESLRSRRSSTSSTGSILSSCSNINRESQTFAQSLTLFEIADVNDAYIPQYKGSPINPLLGKGMTSTVTKARRISDDTYFAVKKVDISKMQESRIKSLQREIAILQSFDYPHIAKLYEVCERPDREVNLVLELGSGGDLYDRLKKVGVFNEVRAADIIEQMLSTLQYIHKNGIIHRDLKLENWVFRDHTSDEIMLIDFGLSLSVADKSLSSRRRVGTSYYFPPESFQGDYSFASDIWSTGVIIYMMMSGTAPFGGRNDGEIMNNIRFKRHSFSSNQWSNISIDAQSFVSLFLQRDPDKRVATEKALQHPWMTKNITKKPIAELNVDLLQHMARFSQYPPLKKLILRIMAYNISYSEVSNTYKCFEAIDEGNKGHITFSDLQVLVQSETSLDMNGIDLANNLFAIFTGCCVLEEGLINLSDFVACNLEEKHYLDKSNIRRVFETIDSEKRGYVSKQTLEEFLGCSYLAEEIKAYLTQDVTSTDEEDYYFDFESFERYIISTAPMY